MSEPLTFSDISTYGTTVSPPVHWRVVTDGIKGTWFRSWQEANRDLSIKLNRAKRNRRPYHWSAVECGIPSPGEEIHPCRE